MAEINSVQSLSGVRAISWQLINGRVVVRLRVQQPHDWVEANARQTRRRKFDLWISNLSSVGHAM